MSNSQSPTGKIVTGLKGLGVPSPEMVEARAFELAKSDGRREPNNGDRESALAELQGVVEPQDPEVDPGLENLTEWDGPPGERGTQAPSRALDDEANVGEVLVEEGLEEADHDIRLSSTDGVEDEAEDDEE